MPARVFVLYTGGTIGMAPEENSPGSPLVPQPLDKLLEYIGPGFRDLSIQLTFDSFFPPLDSSDIGLEEWTRMAKVIERHYDGYDGFVVLHGTDTICYTASALSFMFENLAKPVVLTGSQLPISALRTDAVANLVNAISLAGYKAAKLPCIPEVVIVFGNRILRGCRARKISSVSMAGIDSPNFPSLGVIGAHIRVNTDLLRPPPGPRQPFRVDTAFCDRVIDVSLFPGLTSSQLHGMLVGLEGVHGIVLRTFGAGNAPTRTDFLAVIEAACATRTVVNVTQCLEGTVEMGLYEASSGLLERGVISALDMTPEAALTKLMWTLGSTPGERVATQMQVSQRGEQSENLFDLRYGGCANADNATNHFIGRCTADSRFRPNRLTRAVLRLSGLGLSGLALGTTAELRIFLNFPVASEQTPPQHPSCIARIRATWQGRQLNLIHEIDVTAARSVIQGRDAALSIVAGPGAGFWFSGAYLALYCEAR